MNDPMILPPIREMPTASLVRRKSELVAILRLDAPISRRQGRRRRSRRLAVLLAASLVMLGLLMVALPALTSRTPLVAPPAGASERLEQAASALGGSARVGPGQYSYLHREDRVLSGILIDGTTPIDLLVRHDDHYWVAQDGSGRATTHTQDPVFATDADGQAYLAAGEPPVFPPVGKSSQDFGPGGLAVDGMEELPADPAQALAYIREGNLGGGPHPSDSVVFDAIGEALTRTYLPTDVRQTLYRAAALIPRVEALNGLRDQQGRGGTAVALHDVDGWHTLLFDPETGAFFERAFYPGDPGSDRPVGGPELWTTVIDSGMVDEVGDVP